VNTARSQPVNIGIFYFSGNGNTKTITYLLSEELQKKGCHVDIFAIDGILRTKNNPSLQSYDIVGFGYPVHAFNAPRIFFEYLRTLPVGNQKKTFVFKTSGDPWMNGGSTALVRKELQKKGYEVCYER